MMVWNSLIAIFLLASSVRGGYDPDLITSLPGLAVNPTFKQYSGYLNANEGRQFHYWLVESKSDPSTDPLVLWLNGGPGCSSLLGFLGELGPFLVDENGQDLSLNDYSWNKFANVLFLESPAGVGFSYDPSGAYESDDDRTADDNYAAILDFFKKFPEFTGREFFITGESYGGVYIPTLSVRVLRGPNNINFKGYAIGNGLLSDEDQSNSVIFFGYYHGLYDKALWDRLSWFCCKGSVSQYACRFSNPPNNECKAAVTEARTIIGAGLNGYNLYQDCISNKSAHNHRPPHTKRGYFDRRLQFRILRLGEPPLHEFIPSCIPDDSIAQYLSSPEVRSALHIPSNALNWSECSNVLKYKQYYKTVKPEIEELVHSGKLRSLIYNGDVDMVCNFLGDQWFVHDLGLRNESDYRAWKHGNVIAGYTRQFERNLTLVTLKGSGHMVPHDKPGPALQMLDNFLNNKPF